MKTILRSPKLLVLLIVVLAVSVIVFFVVGRPERESIRIVTPPAIIASLPHWVAETKDFYRDENLNVRTISVTSSNLMVQAITSNDADVLPAVSLVDVINSQSQALDRPLIFSHSRLRTTPPFESLVVLNGSPISAPKDLEGKRIAVYPGTTATECLKLFLKNSGINTDAISFRPLRPPEHLPAMQRGDVDASHLYDPHRTQALEGGLCREISRGIYASLNEPSAIGVSAISARFVQEHPIAAQSYLKAWDRSIRFIREHPDEARAILASKLNLSPQTASTATWVDATLLSELDRSAINETIETIKAIGLVPADFHPSSETHLFQPR